MRIIDAHVHPIDEPGYLDKLLATMDELGIERCCLSGLGDFFGFGGIYMIFHGLEMYKPWIAYTVSGAILMLFGFGWFNPPNKAKK